MYKSCASLRDEFEKEETRHLVKILKPPSPFVQYRVHHPPPAPAEKKESSARGQVEQQSNGLVSGRQVATGKAATEIDTSAEETVAWIFDYCSRERMRINLEENGNMPRLQIAEEQTGSNSAGFATLKKMPFPFHLREFVSACRGSR